MDDLTFLDKGPFDPSFAAFSTVLSKQTKESGEEEGKVDLREAASIIKMVLTEEDEEEEEEEEEDPLKERNAALGDENLLSWLKASKEKGEES